MRVEDEPIRTLEDRISYALHAYKKNAREILQKEDFTQEDAIRLGCLLVYYRLTADIAARDLATRTKNPDFAWDFVIPEIMDTTGAINMAKTGDFVWVKECLSYRVQPLLEAPTPESRNLAKKLETLIKLIPDHHDPFVFPRYPWGDPQVVESKEAEKYSQ